MWYSGSGVILYCIDSWSLPPFLFWNFINGFLIKIAPLYFLVRSISFCGDLLILKGKNISVCHKFNNKCRYTPEPLFLDPYFHYCKYSHASKLFVYLDIAVAQQRIYKCQIESRSGWTSLLDVIWIQTVCKDYQQKNVWPYHNVRILTIKLIKWIATVRMYSCFMQFES